MANKEHLDILKQGVEVWNRWREKHPKIPPDLSEADLEKVNLSGINLRGTDPNPDNLCVGPVGFPIVPTNLWGANLRKADLREANLTAADLSRADLREANLSGSDLSEGDFIYGTNVHIPPGGARLREANLTGANLSGTDLSGTVLSGTVFAYVDLRSVKGLVEIRHQGPSIVQLHTIQLPQDGSAVHFLRGTGLPDEWIDFYRAAMMKPIMYHSLFISYSSKDEDIAKRLLADLQNSGVRCWFAPHDLRPGTVILKGIDEAIHMYDKLLLILSRHSVESNWVEHEVDMALFKEMQKKHQDVLLPIRLDDAILQSPSEWAKNICYRHIGDFTKWKRHDDYKQAFNRLLCDLKAETAKGNG